MILMTWKFSLSALQKLRIWIWQKPDAENVRNAVSVRNAGDVKNAVSVRNTGNAEEKDRKDEKRYGGKVQGSGGPAGRYAHHQCK